MNTPHTGHVSYEDKVPRIPAACITKEDAEMLYRMYSRGVISQYKQFNMIN
jgi:carboxypeptidase Q